MFASRALSMGFLLLGTCAVASAAPVTWKFAGRISQISDPAPLDLPPFIALGAPYGLTVTFDPAKFGAPTGGTCIPNADGQCRYAGTVADASSVSIAFGNNDCDSDLNGVQPCTPSAPTIDRIFVFNNWFSGAPAGFDALMFVFFDQGDHRTLVTLRGPTSVFSSPVGIPTTLPAGLTENTFEFCDRTDILDAFSACQGPPPAGVTAQAEVIDGPFIRGAGAIPEPGSLALLGLGLTGLGFSRRRP